MGVIQTSSREKYDKHSVMEAFQAEGKEVRVGKVTFQKGGRVPETGYAVHEEDEYVYVLKGMISFGVEGEKYCLKEGNFHYMPKGEPHWCRNESETESELLYILVSA